MDQQQEKFGDFLADRLLLNVTTEKQEPGMQLVGERGVDNSAPKATVRKKKSRGVIGNAGAAVDRIGLEKNFASIGFFSPSSKRTKNEKAKVVTFRRIKNGVRQEFTATIVPSGMWGLPITADQDKWFAFQKIISEKLNQEGEIKNPVVFNTADLLRLLDMNTSGKNYQEVKEWIDVMFGTWIKSEGTVYFAGKKQWKTDRFRVFDRVTTRGEKLEDGTIAEENYIWLSDWQLENLNSKYLLPVDFEAYKQLRTHIAKALVPLLQVWLYASRDVGLFEKRYDDICEILAIRKYKSPSDIKREFGAALDELIEHKYLSAYRLEKLERGQYKVVFYHGEKFLAGRKKITEKKPQDLPSGEEVEQNDRPAYNDVPIVNEAGQGSLGLAPVPEVDTALVAELVNRGVTPIQAKDLLSQLPKGQPIEDQIELWDNIVARKTPPLDNPPGFLIYMLRGNHPLPPGFESKRSREARATREQEKAAEEAQLRELRLRYEDYARTECERFISANYTPEKIEELIDKKQQEYKIQLGGEQEPSKDFGRSLAAAYVRSDLAKQAGILSLEDYIQAQTLTGQTTNPDQNQAV